MLIAFWISLALVVYIYFGYPALLWLWMLGPRKSFHRAPTQPRVTVIVAAHNEERCIENKLRNLLALDYPRERVQLLVGSDGCSDRTEEIVGEFVREGVALVSFGRQRGKSAVQNSLVDFASGEILVFTDADCLLQPGALSRLLENFSDPRVGLVGARPAFRNSSDSNITANESLYLRYEAWLREMESERGLLAMASGSLFAIRRSLWQPLAPHFGDDFVLPLRVIRAGFHNLLDPRVVSITNLSQTRPRSMLRMKTRVISKDFRALLSNRDLLDPARFGGTAVSLWSHKLLRWLVPYFLLVLLATNAFLASHAPWGLFLALQICFYLMALAGFLLGERSRFPWTVPASFCLVNFAALVGTFKAIWGPVPGAWKTERPAPAAGINSTVSSRADK